MRHITNINRKWAFTKQTTEIPASIDPKWDFVNLPHSWNALDGQDGGNDYYRSTAIYAKELDREELPESQRYYIEIRGANSSADLYVNGKKFAHHDGGYSTWRCDITSEIGLKTMIALAVDRSIRRSLTLPSMAVCTVISTSSVFPSPTLRWIITAAPALRSLPSSQARMPR